MIPSNIIFLSTAAIRCSLGGAVPKPIGTASDHVCVQDSTVCSRNGDFAKDQQTMSCKTWPSGGRIEWGGGSGRSIKKKQREGRSPVLEAAAGPSRSYCATNLALSGERWTCGTGGQRTACCFSPTVGCFLSQNRKLNFLWKNLITKEMDVNLISHALIVIYVLLLFLKLHVLSPSNFKDNGRF